MTGVAGGNAPAGVDPIVMNQFFAQRDLLLGRLPVHIEYMLAGPDILFRCPMAFETPAHVKGIGLTD